MNYDCEADESCDRTNYDYRLLFLLGGKNKKITKRRTTGSRSEAKNRDIFSKRAQTHSAKAPFERDLVLNEKTYDF